MIYQYLQRTLVCIILEIHWYILLLYGNVVVDPLLPDYWGGSPLLLSYGGSPPAFPASHLAGLLRRRDPSTNPGPIAWWVSVGNWRDVVWYVRECDKGGRVVMGVLRRRFCVDMIGGKGIYLFLVGLGYDAWLYGNNRVYQNSYNLISQSFESTTLSLLIFF